jgi:aminodeoxyfutalosine synthase
MNLEQHISTLNEQLPLPPGLRSIGEKVISNERISDQEALELFNSTNLAFLGALASAVKRRQSKDYVFFNKNFHIEPTNICTNNCKFCSYRRRKGQEGAWDCTIEEVVEMVKKQASPDVSEVHIVGGVHPDHDIFFYADMLKAVREVAPGIHIKAFTAVEIDQMCKKSGMDFQQGLLLLKNAGLNSMPGGGAEIFDEVLREEICPGKTSSTDWLKIHETAHQLGIPTNATILYGLKESYEQRIDHLGRLRKLQDKTHGFNAFIPLKFKKANNLFSNVGETSIIEDMKNYAVTRIYLDNVPHLKAYWPMIGKQEAQLSLAFGVDDLDGTIDDSTRIYSMAGSEEQNPSASVNELVTLIKNASMVPVLRDSLYNVIKTYNPEKI